MPQLLAFHNFDLHTSPGSDDVYPVSVLYSPAGETRTPVPVRIALDEPPLKNWLQQFKVGTIQRATLLELGQQLSGFLLPAGPVRDLYRGSLGLVEAGRSRLRLRLRIFPPQLTALPWEFAYDDVIGEFFALNPLTVLVRYPSEPIPPSSVSGVAPMPILVVVSSPTGVQSIDAVREVNNLLGALKRLLGRGQVQLDILFGGANDQRQALAREVLGRIGVRLLPLSASLDALVGALRQEYRIVHYIGHGMVEDDSKGGALVLTVGDGGPRPVYAQELAREMRGMGISGVVLNACASAVDGTAASFLGLAPALIRAGIPAVVAMQHDIRDSSAVRFSGELYRALADGWPLDAAVTEGRKAIHRYDGDENWDWGVPVLFMRSSDGVLWAPASRSDDITTGAEGLSQRMRATTDENEQKRTVEMQFLAEGVGAYTERLRLLAGRKGHPAPAQPYKGLLEYDLDDVDVFFGRDEAIDHLLSHLARGPLTVLHAESGTGKTSLLQAGIQPRLVANGHLPLYVRSNKLNPTLAIKRALVPEFDAISALSTLPLSEFLQRVTSILGPETRLYIFLDQFEESFTQFDEASRAGFAAELADCMASKRDLNVRWLIALRSEAFSDLASLRPYIRNPFENDYRLSRLTRAEAEEVIVKPAALYGVTYEVSLVQRLLDDLEKEGIAPPQAQLVCQALYEALAPGDTVIGEAIYDRLGAAAGIFRDHLEQVLRRDLPRGQRQAARFLLEELVTSDARRVLRTRGELAGKLASHAVAPQTMDAVLAQLVDSRLLRVQESGAAGDMLAYELAHDYLAGQIEVSPEVRGRKAAQELLERESLNWKLHGALMHPKALEVVAAHGDSLSIDAAAAELIARSTIETGGDVFRWLKRLEPNAVRQVLLDGMASIDPEVRARAASHAGPWLDAELETRLATLATGDNAPAVRRAALEILSKVAPGRARTVLLGELRCQDPVRRAEAATSLRSFIDAESVAALYACVLTEQDGRVLDATFGTLAGDAAALYRNRWQPLLRAKSLQEGAALLFFATTA